MAVRSRAWRGYDDLRPMQELAIEVRRREGRRAPWHIGDLAWGFRQHAGREGEWTIRIWAESAIVYSYDERAAALYDAVGFEPHTRVVAYSREPGGGTP
jgi:hypothetical protein